MIINSRMKRTDWPAQREGLTWIYIICAGDPPCASKVGVGVDLFSRLRQQSYRYRDRKFPVRLHCAYRVPDGDGRNKAEAVESRAHAMLAPWRFSVSGGDWFLLPPARVEIDVRIVIDDVFKVVASYERFPS